MAQFSLGLRSLRHVLAMQFFAFDLRAVFRCRVVCGLPLRPKICVRSSVEAQSAGGGCPWKLGGVRGHFCCGRKDRLHAIDCAPGLGLKFGFERVFC